MANIKSAQKRMRQAEKRRTRNKGLRSRLRTAVKKYRSAEGDAKARTLPETYSEVDRAVKKGVIHPNAAARYKSRLARHSTAKP